MYARLTRHRHVMEYGRKEPLWFYDYGTRRATKFANYLSFYMRKHDRFHRVKETCDGNVNETCYPIRFGDFSTRELMNEFHVYAKGNNRWDMILHLNPTMKFIVFMREPIERLYSDFIYFSKAYKSGNPITPLYFHAMVQRQIEWWTTCTHKYDKKNCLFGEKIGDMPKLSNRFKNAWGGPNVCGAFRIGFYSYFIDLVRRYST